MRFLFKPFCASALALSLTLSAAQPSASAETTLYDNLGGDEGLTTVVQTMLAYSLADPRINEIFANSNLERLEGLLIVHLCDIADGPCEYTGQHMRRAHHGLGIKSMHFNALVEHLQKAMDEADIPFRTQNKLLARLAPMHDDITERTDIPSLTP